jgi:stress-induced morphogen
MHHFHSSDLPSLPFLVGKFWQLVTNGLSGKVWHTIDLKAIHQKSHQGVITQGCDHPKAKINSGGHRGLSKITRKEISKP